MSTYRIARRLSDAANVVESFAGTQAEPERPVVVKRLVTPWAQGEGFVQRYLGAGSPPRAPGLPELYEVGTANNVVYLVQEWIEGESLRHAMTALAQKKGFIAPPEGLAIVGKLAHLLSTLHGRASPLVHGDVCPSTTLLTPRGQVYLLDAQIASAAGATTTLGPARAEPYSLAPDQLTSTPTPATDMFRLGLVLFELALGRPLFAGIEPAQLLSTCQRFPGLKRDSLKQVPEPYATLLVELLSPNPATRPTAAAVDATLRAAMQKAGWTQPDHAIAKLFSRAFPDRQPLASSLSHDGHELRLESVGGGARPSVTPPGSAVVARITTRKVTKSELDKSRGTPVTEPTVAAATPEEEPGGPKDMRLGAMLVEKGQLTRAKLDEALEQVDVYGGTLGDALLALGSVDEDVIVTALAELTKTPAMTAKKLQDMQPAAEALARVPLELARSLDLVPLALKGGTQLLVAMKDPMDGPALERLKEATGLKSIVAMRGGEGAIRRTRNRFYTGKEDDVADWLERDSAPSRLLSAQAPPMATGSGIFELEPEPVSAPYELGELLLDEEPAPPAAQAVGVDSAAAIRIIETLLTVAGEPGRQGQQLASIATLVAERLGAPSDRVKLACLALVAANLREGRPPWDVPTIESLSGVLGGAWGELEPLISPVLDFPARVPTDPGAQALCAAFAFANHAGQPKPAWQAAHNALASFRARFRFPSEVTSALAAALA